MMSAVTILKQQVGCLLLLCSSAICVAAEPASGRAARPTGDDYSAGSLREYQQALEDSYGGYLSVPLDVKARHFEWVLWRYHLSPLNQVHERIELSSNAGKPPHFRRGADTSTWNGALLSALSFKYAVTRDAETLDRIATLLKGLHHFQVVTGMPGLAARCVIRRDEPVDDFTERYEAPDGTVYYFRGDPAKGTYNHLAAGYSALMMLVAPDLPADIRKLAHDDLTALVQHLVDHDYRLTKRDGSRTPYGNMTPLIGSQSIPFNAQVAYQIVAAGHVFPPQDTAVRQRIDGEFDRLRRRHHVYYESPFRNLVLPQRVGGSPLMKGMNDRNHVLNAAFNGLMLEFFQAQRDGRPVDQRFVEQLGQTMWFTIRRIHNDHNSLCNFMWCGLLREPTLQPALLRGDRDEKLELVQPLIANGVQQLRHFRLQRFARHGEKIKTADPVWVDSKRAFDSYSWKTDGFTAWKPDDRPPLNITVCSTDYLYAYWLMRYFDLQQAVAERR